MPQQVKKTPEYLGLGQEPGVLRLPGSLEIVRKKWFEDSNVEKVIVSNSIRELKDYAFYRCQKLREVVFESGSHLERIGEACFAGCGIESMCLPRSLRDIDI